MFPWIKLPLLFFSLVTYAGEPRIEIDRLTHDFGEVTGEEQLAGTFVVVNTGTDNLHLSPPASSCECTVAEWKKSTLKPGERTELNFVVKVPSIRRQIREQILILSNDPRSAIVSVAVLADYKPLFELLPSSLVVNLPRNSTTNFLIQVRASETRTFSLSRVETGRPWIKGKIVSRHGTEKEPAVFKLELRGDAPQGQYDERINIYLNNDTNRPAAVLAVFCEIVSEFISEPPMVIWRFRNTDHLKKSASENLGTKRIRVTRASGKPFRVKKVVTSVKDLSIELLGEVGTNMYELAATLPNAPEKTVTGKIILELFEPADHLVEVPVTISVIETHDRKVP